VAGVAGSARFELFGTGAISLGPAWAMADADAKARRLDAVKMRNINISISFFESAEMIFSS